VDVARHIVNMPATKLGAYGLQIEGLQEAAEWMRPVPGSAPELEVRLTGDVPPTDVRRIDRDGLDIRLQGMGDVRVRMERASRRVDFSFTGRVPPAADVLHPYLGPAAAAAHAWEGREAIHAGAFRTARGAVLLLGDKEAGKSSMLAWLSAELDQEVVADDLCVLQSGAVLPGPSCIDLRDPTALRYGSRWSGQLVRASERIRLAVRQGGADPVPVAGNVVLGWADRVRIESVSPVERLGLIVAQRYFGSLEPDPVAVLDLLSRPMVRLLRPRDLSSLPAAAEALLAHWS
jgi:hypothetical protein